MSIATLTLKSDLEKPDIIDWCTANIGPQSGNSSVVEAHGWYWSSNVNVTIVSATISNRGTGTFANSYKPHEVLAITGGTANNSNPGNVMVNKVQIGTANIISGGTKYTVGDTFTWGNSITPPVLTVATTSGDGVVASVTITEHGEVNNVQISNTSTYTTAVTANANASGAVFNNRWDIHSLYLNNPGDYSVGPTSPAALTGSAHGTGATANITLLNQNRISFANASSDFARFNTTWNWIKYGGSGGQQGTNL